MSYFRGSMSKYTSTLCGILAALAATVASPVARAQAGSPVCKTLTDAHTKEITTPHHAYSTQGSSAIGSPVITGETISTSAASYVLHKGKWQRINITPQDNVKQMQENMHDLKSYTCRQLPDATLDGVATAVYTAHTESDMAKTDDKLWIAKGTGLISREEIDLYTDDGGAKAHISERFVYTNVQPPPGV